MISVDAIFFDVDGTLVDARKDIVNAVNYAMRRLGLKARPFELVVSYIGTGVKDLIEKSLGADKSEFAEEGVKLFSDYYVKHPTDEAKLYPHVRETLDYFRTKRKFILTNRYSRFADAALSGLGIRQYFEEIIGGDDENCLKPSACVLNNLLPGLKLKKAECIIVGDMAIDIMTGKNSGIATCWVSYGLDKREDIEPLKPDYMIDDIAELKTIIAEGRNNG